MLHRLRENWRKNPYPVLASFSLMMSSAMGVLARHGYLPSGAALEFAQCLVLGLGCYFFWKFIVRVSQPR